MEIFNIKIPFTGDDDNNKYNCETCRDSGIVKRRPYLGISWYPATLAEKSSAELTIDRGGTPGWIFDTCPDCKGL